MAHAYLHMQETFRLPAGFESVVFVAVSCCVFVTGKNRAHKLKKVPGTPAGCPKNTRRDRDVVYHRKKKLTEEGIFAGTPLPGVPGHPAAQGAFRNFM